MPADVDILDCTLRDGSYALDFQFTAEDTGTICAALETAGCGLIEIGHGFGLGASGPRWGQAAATDEAYLRAAQRSLKTAKFGAFFIPGIGTKEHLDLARDCGMHFVRVGTNITQSEAAEPFIKYAVSLGFEVSYNGMKSYVVPPEEFLRRARQTVEWGASCVSLVDSAGGMLPDEVTAYISLMRQHLDVRLGFHGHNNFMLAVANSLAAIDAGATLVDTTLAGIGRSGGNAQTEIMIVLLEKMGRPCGIDKFAAMEAADTLIRPKMQEASGIKPIDLTMACAQFHSSFLDRIHQAVAKFPVDPRVLIIEVSNQDKVNPSQELIFKIAEELWGRSNK